MPMQARQRKRFSAAHSSPGPGILARLLLLASFTLAMQPIEVPNAAGVSWLIRLCFHLLFLSAIALVCKQLPSKGFVYFAGIVVAYMFTINLEGIGYYLVMA